MKLMLIKTKSKIPKAILYQTKTKVECVLKYLSSNSIAKSPLKNEVTVATISDNAL